MTNVINKARKQFEQHFGIKGTKIELDGYVSLDAAGGIIAHATSIAAGVTSYTPGTTNVDENVTISKLSSGLYRLQLQGKYKRLKAAVGSMTSYDGGSQGLTLNFIDKVNVSGVSNSVAQGSQCIDVELVNSSGTATAVTKPCGFNFILKLEV